MVLSPEYIRSLPGDQECIAALAWLAEQATRYPTDRFTPPLKRRKRDDEIRPFLALTMRLGWLRRGSVRARINEYSWCIDGDVTNAVGSDQDMVSALAENVLRRKYRSHFIFTSGKSRHVLDVWLEQHGPLLLKLGYTLQPCLTGGAVSFVTIRKGRDRWDLVYFETATAGTVRDGISLARDAGWTASTRAPRSLLLWRAVGAYARWLLATFGVAVQLTAGMASVAAARATLPADFVKWTPAPLLVAMCREGGGYRGGITYATRYRGPTWRIDVTRQYTAALAGALPLRSAFGYIPHRPSGNSWLAVCRVRLAGPVPYPLAIWHGPDNGFSVRAVPAGEYVCILSSGELPGLLAIGATIQPAYGYVHHAAFSFASYVEILRVVMEQNGRDSPEARFCKPLGNYVYGKLGQLPTRTEMMFSEENPGKEWFPYWDEEGTPWTSIWERTIERHTVSQHVEIAATITAIARSQTVSMWASLSEQGFRVLRCHTDSLTLDSDPSGVISLSGGAPGDWRLEQCSDDSVIVGANAYFADGEAHIAGVSEPTYEMIERMADGRAVAITQTMKTPRRGFRRGERSTERTYRAAVR